MQDLELIKKKRQRLTDELNSIDTSEEEREVIKTSRAHLDAVSKRDAKNDRKDLLAKQIKNLLVIEETIEELKQEVNQEETENV